MSPRDASEGERAGLRDFHAGASTWAATTVSGAAPELTPRAFEVRSLVAEALDGFTQRAVEKGVSLEVKIAPTVPARVIGDFAWLREVMFGLLDNALKYTDGGEVVASVSCDPTAGGRALLHVEISDTGAGMSAATLAELFEARRERDGAVPAAVASGGIPVAQRLIELMDGSMGCSSAVGMGTTAWFTVPLDLPSRQV